MFFLYNSLTEVYFLGFSWCIKEGSGHTQSVKRPAPTAGPESQWTEAEAEAEAKAEVEAEAKAEALV